MKEIPDGSVDLVLCDPPYGIDYQSSRGIDKSKRHPKILNDKRPFTDGIELIKPLLRKSWGVLLFTRWDVQQTFIDELNTCGLKTKSVIIWNKVSHGMGDLKRSFGSMYESILWVPMEQFTFPQKRPKDIITCQKISGDKLVHPNQKPTELLESLITAVTKKVTQYLITAWDPVQPAWRA